MTLTVRDMVGAAVVTLQKTCTNTKHTIPDVTLGCCLTVDGLSPRPSRTALPLNDALAPSKDCKAAPVTLRYRRKGSFVRSLTLQSCSLLTLICFSFVFAKSRSNVHASDLVLCLLSRACSAASVGTYLHPISIVVTEYLLTALC